MAPDICPYCGDKLPKLKFICDECEHAQHMEHEVEASRPDGYTPPEPTNIGDDDEDD